MADVLHALTLGVSACATLFAIIVLGVTSSKVSYKPEGRNSEICLFSVSVSGKKPRLTLESSDGACGFAEAMGVLGLVFGIPFCIMAAFEYNTARSQSSTSEPPSGSVQPQASKNLDKVRASFSGFLSFLFLICFGVAVSKWSDTKDVFDYWRLPFNETTARVNAEVVITFSFFSFVAWGALGIMYAWAVIRAEPQPEQQPKAAEM